MSYEDYLASPGWRKIRERVLRRDRYRCRSCGRRATEVHHASYDRLTMDGGDDRNLYSLCRECHDAVTFDGLGRKRSRSEVAEMCAALPPVAPKPPKRSRTARIGGGQKKRDRSLEGIRAASQRYAEGRSR